MNEKREPFEISEEEGKRWARFFTDFLSVSSIDSMLATLRAFVAEHDLIPRPQTVEEWAALIPGDVWKHPSVRSCDTAIYIYSDNDSPDIDPEWIMATIPRPAPAKLTDEEIEERARMEAMKATMKEPSWSWDVQVDAAIDAYNAERARLEKERGE